MTKFINLLKETWGVIEEQDGVDPAAVDPAMMGVPPPPAGAAAQADIEDLEGSDESEPTELRQEEIDLVTLARALFLYGLNTDRSTINDTDFAKIIQKVTEKNADEIKAVMERLVRDNQVETGI
jgi:hypothetical protein